MGEKKNKDGWNDADLPVVASHKEVTTAWGDDDLPVVDSKKKSSDLSESVSLGSKATSPDATKDNPQQVLNNIFGKDISGNPIINTTPHNSPQPANPKEETNQAVNILANHGMQNALPHYEGNLKNTQFTEPGNVVHDITNPHGDAQMTGSYAKYGIEQLKLQRQQELGQLAQSGGSTNPDYQQQEDAINSKYNEQIGALQNAAKHLISLQLANREYTAKKYTQAEADDKISDLDKEYKKELSTATGGGDINIAKTAFEKAKAEIKRNTKYDAVQLGIEQRKMFGDKSAEEDLVKYNNGQPIPEDRKVAYQLNGLNIIQTGARNAAANGQDDVAKDMSDNSSDIQERLEKDNPRYFQKQYAQQIGSYLYNNEHNPLFGTLFARGVPEEDKIKAAGQAAGLTPAQIRQVRPEDIPTTASMLGQAAQGAFNAFLFQNDKDPYGELFTGKMPQEQHTFNNWRGVTGEIASGAGTIAGFLAQGGIIGEGLKSGEILGNVATNAKNYETASNLIPLALSNYNNAYEQSKEIIGDKPKDELKRHAYAALNATISTAIMSIDPATAIGKDALGATNEGRDIIGMLKKDGLSNISPIDFKDKIAPIIAHAATAGEETAKHIGSQALIMASNKAAENVTDMFFDPEHRHGIMDNVGQSAIQGGISMFLPSLFAGINTSRMENPSNKELLWDVGNNSKDYRAQVTDLYKQGKMSQGDFLTSINGINKAAGIIKSDVLSTNAVSDVPLTDQQKKDYAWNLLQTNEVTDKIAALGEKSDKSQVKLLNDRLTELTGERSKILDKAGEEILVEKPVLKPQENISEKPTKKSKEELSLNSDNSSQQNVTSNGQKTSNEQDNGQSRSKESEAQDIGPNSELRQAAGMEGVAGEENRQVEAPGGTNNKEGGAEMQPPISVSNKERRKRKPLVVDEEPIPVIEEPNLQTQDLGEVKGQPEAKTEEQLKEATVNHPEKPADVLVSEKPQGESFNDAKDRYKKAVDEIAKDAPDNTVVVTHSWGLKLLDAVEKTGWDHPELAAEHQKGSTETGDLIPYKMEDGRTIWFARHGETEDNTNDLQRTDDTPLTKKGIEQAKEIAHKLKEKGITPSQIITSDLPRAKETSDIISKEFKEEPQENKRPQPPKPLDEMTGEDLSAFHDSLKEYNKSIDKNILGDKYKEYREAQAVSDSSFSSAESRKKVYKKIDEIENSLSESDRNLLLGIGSKNEITNEDQIKPYRDKVELIEASENENDLAKNISQSLIDLNNIPADSGEMSEKQKVAISAMKAAKRVIDERGYDGKKVTTLALKFAADKFKDPADAEFMLSKYIDYTQNNKENASTQSEELQQKSLQQGGEPEHARTEQRGSEKPPTETEGSNERSEGGQEARIKPPEGFTASKSNDTRKDGKHIFKKQDGDISHEIVVKDDGSVYITTTDKKLLTGVDEHSKSMESDIKEFKNIDEAVKYIDEQKLSVKFKTSKGSEYILHADGTTTRNKAAREDVGHEGEQGIQPRSEKTYFITKEDLGKLDLVQTSGWPEGEKPTIADLGNGKIAVGITGGERHGKYMPETEVKYRTEPQTGLYPLEVLKGGAVHHFGNEITSVENTGKPQETPQSNGAIATEATKEQPAQPPKEKTSQERLSEIEEDLKKQRASQKLESEKRTKAEKEKDIPAANKANENWHKKKEKIDKLEEEKESIQKKMEREEREESIKKVYNDFADKLQNKYEANKEKHKGVALSGIVGLSTKIGDHVADFVVTRAIEGIRELGNIHIAIDRAIRLAKEKFGTEAEDLSKKDINAIRTHLIDELGQKEPSIDKEPVLPIDHEEYAKDILADIKNGHITAEEGLQEVANEQIVNRQGQPVSDHVSENNKAKIQNYIKWHVDQDVTSIRNATTRLRREQFGLNEEIPAAKKEFGKTWEEAKEKIEDNPQKIPELIHELSQKARPLTDVENAILLHHQNTKEIELLNFNDKINKAAEEGNQADINEYKASKARVLDELQQIYDINKEVGTENARGLASRRMMVDRKYSLVNMLSEKRATANEGKPLSEQQQAEVETLHKKIKETQDAFDEYIKKSESQIIDLQRKALNGKLKDKKTASTKLREWAEKIRNASKNQAYSSPIPITPHMMADAIDLIAYGVEKGEQLVDLVKRAVAATSKGNPGIDEDHLEREINKALIDSGILEVSPERRAATDMSGLFSNGKLDREAIRLKTEADRAKAQYDINLKKDREKELSGLTKAQNWFVKWERAGKLSNPLTIGKLFNAGFTRLITTPLEDIVGGAYSAILPQLANGSIGEGGGFNVNETAKAYKNGLMLGIKDAGQIINSKAYKTIVTKGWKAGMAEFKKGSQGKSDLDVLFGKAGELPPEAIDFFGQLHSATKAPFKRIMFERSLERRSRRLIASGADITDPMVQTSILVGAYKDANRAIFMQDNKVAEAWQKLIKHFEQIDPKTNEPRMQGVATAMQVLVPFVKVPSNIVAETGKHIYGVPVALYKLAVARFKGGIENLSEDQKDIILRNLKKGSLGVAAMALGYFNAQNFGGYYQPGQKRKEDDAEALGFKIFGHKIPAWAGEAPIFQAMQLGATVKRVSDHYIEGEKQGLPEGVITGLLDVVQSNPLASQPLRISALFKSSKERQYYLGELAKSTVDPAIITYLAKVTDPADKGNPIRKALAPENKRKTPKTIVDHIKSGLPFLREQLPTKEEDWSQ